MDSPLQVEEAEALSVTGRIAGEPLAYTIDLRPTRDQGLEIVVYLVNESEGELEVTGAWIVYALDRSCSQERPLAFHLANRHGHFVLDQFQVAEGHYHIRQNVHAARRFAATIAIEFDQAGRSAHVEIMRRLPTAVLVGS